jgi:hypothetical protein
MRGLLAARDAILKAIVAIDVAKPSRVAMNIKAERCVRS